MEAGAKIRIELEAHGLVEVDHRDVTLSLTLILAGESVKLLFGEGTFRVSPELQGWIVGTAVLDLEEGTLTFVGSAFSRLPSEHPEFSIVGEPMVYAGEEVGPTEDFPFGSLTAYFGPIPPDFPLFPGETLTFTGAGHGVVVLRC